MRVVSERWVVRESRGGGFSELLDGLLFSSQESRRGSRPVQDVVAMHERGPIPNDPQALVRLPGFPALGPQESLGGIEECVFTERLARLRERSLRTDEIAPIEVQGWLEQVGEEARGVDGERPGEVVLGLIGVALEEEVLSDEGQHPGVVGLCGMGLREAVCGLRHQPDVQEDQTVPGAGFRPARLQPEGFLQSKEGIPVLEALSRAPQDPPPDHPRLGVRRI